MNELSQYLVNHILLEDTELHNFVVVYSGRFQPFHKGHYATYQNLCKKFGKDKVFIGTSNKTDNRQSPFNFKEKKIIMTKKNYILLLHITIFNSQLVVLYMTFIKSRPQYANRKISCPFLG